MALVGIGITSLTSGANATSSAGLSESSDETDPDFRFAVVDEGHGSWVANSKSDSGEDADDK